MRKKIFIATGLLLTALFANAQDDTALTQILSDLDKRLSALENKQATATQEKTDVNMTECKTLRNIVLTADEARDSENILVVKKNTPVSIVSKNGDRSQIKFGNQTGWATTKYLRCGKQ